MRVLIIEDEKPASEKLKKALRAYDQTIQVAAVLTSVKDSVRWLKEHAQPDVMLLDIELSDGSSLEVFKHHPVTCPVIFTTAYDQYLIDAFEYNAIDYLLKPIKPEKLKKALDRYQTFQNHFIPKIAGLLEHLGSGDSYRKRVLVKSGSDYVSVPVDDIAYFASHHKVVFLVNHSGQKWMFDRSLGVLEEELDPAIFFRLNRQVIVHIAAVKKFRPAEKGKIKVEIQPPMKEPVTVSQERASLFRGWIEK